MAEVTTNTETLRQDAQSLRNGLFRADISTDKCVRAQTLITQKYATGFYTEPGVHRMFDATGPSPRTLITHNLGVAPLNPSKGPGASHS